MLKGRQPEIGLCVLLQKLLMYSDLLKVSPQINLSRIVISLLKKYCYQKKTPLPQKPSVPDLHIRRVESLKVDYMDNIPDWSNSYRQGNIGQFSEIAEAQSEDAMRENSLVHAIERNQNALSRHQLSNDPSGHRSIQDARIEDYRTNQNVRHNKGSAQRLLKASAIEKAHSFSKPILPPLNIDKIRDDKQNILAIQNFQDVALGDNLHPPIVSAGVTKIKPITGLDLSDGEGENSLVYEKHQTGEITGIHKLCNLAKKMVDQNSTKDLPELTNIMEEAQANDLSTQDPPKLAKNKSLNHSYDTQVEATCACEFEPRSLIMKKLSEHKEAHKNQEEDEDEHHSLLEDFKKDKMRLCLLNLLYTYMAKYEAIINDTVITSSLGGNIENSLECISNLKTSFNTQCINNILYCHLSSNEVYHDINLMETSKSHDVIKDLPRELFDSQKKYLIDFDGTIHDNQDAMTLQNSDGVSITAIDFSEFNIEDLDSLLCEHKLLKVPMISEKQCIFTILSKIARYNEFTLKYQIENTSKMLSNYQNETGKVANISNFSKISMSRTQTAFQSSLGLASPTKTLRNTNQNLSSFDNSAVIANPASSHSTTFWINGVAFSADKESGSSKKVSKEHLRKKSDMFLVRISNSICYKITNINYDDVTWCEEIEKDVSLLTHYIKEVKSRITIFQMIDIVIDPLLAIKRTITEILLKDKRNITGAGNIQSPFLNVESWRGSSHAQKSPSSYQIREHIKTLRNDVNYESKVMKLISTYLELLSNMFLISKTQEVFKLI